MELWEVNAHHLQYITFKFLSEKSEACESLHLEEMTEECKDYMHRVAAQGTHGFMHAL